jgi:hypothetical protein
MKMPVMNLQGMDQRFQILNITAVMCFPSKKDEKKKAFWILRSLLNIAADIHMTEIDSGNLAPDIEKEISQDIGRWLGGTMYNFIGTGCWGAMADATVGPGQKKPVVQEVKDILERGAITGWMLCDMYNNGGGVSTCAERFCTYDNYKKLRKLGVKKPNQDPNNLKDTVWSRFKDAAHLWAAYLKNKNKTYQNRNPKKRYYLLPLALYEPGGLEGFLAIAENFKQWGEKHMPPRGPRKPFLNKDTSWQVKI